MAHGPMVVPPVQCVRPRGQVLGVSNRCHNLLGTSADAVHRADAIVNRHGLANDFSSRCLMKIIQR